MASSGETQDIIDQFNQLHDDDSIRVLVESVVEGFVQQARSGSNPDLLSILGKIDELSKSSPIWDRFRQTTGARLGRLLSKPAVLALDPKRISLADIRSKLISWQDAGVFSRNHIQNALKVLDGLASVVKPAPQKKVREFCFEQARTEQKRRRINSMLRPKNEPDDAEFQEVWHRVCEWDGTVPEHGTVDFGVGIDVYRYEIAADDGPNLTHTVYVWDLDETLILFNCFVDMKRFRNRFSWLTTDVATRIGQFLTDLIFDLADTNFFFKDIEKFEQSHIDDLVHSDDYADLEKHDFSRDILEDEDGNTNWRLLSYRYREIRSRYRKPLAGYISPSTSEKLASCLKEIDRLSSGWLGASQRLLELAWASSASSNVIVSSGQLTPTLVKLMVFGLSPYFPIEHIYSSSTSSKASIFQKILDRYGRNCIYQVIGDGKEEEQACSVFSDAFANVRFTSISSVEDLRRLTEDISK